MKINIASFGGRTHMLDTARELEKLGHEVRFYSFVPTKRALKFGLKKECNKSYFLLAFPFLVIQKLFGISTLQQPLFHIFFDVYVAIFMKPCDIFIGQSPLHLYSLERAKKRYNAITILERGACHVFTMMKVLESIPANKGKRVMREIFIKREQKGYELADYISIPSDFVKQSFIENGINEKKLFINPYGVDLSNFYSTNKPAVDSYDIIMVGRWSYEKGADLIVEVCKKYGFSCLHVGGIRGMDFPIEDNMKHVDAVDEKKLIDYYSQAKVFVLPSQFEGLALVQVQAIACGLPIVCSKNTGGSNLKYFLENKKWIIEMPEYSTDCLAECIKDALQLSTTQLEGKRDYAGDAMKKLTWGAYGERYNDFIIKIM